MLSGHLSSVLADAGFLAAPLLPLTDLRGSLLDTLSLPFTRLDPFTSAVHLHECVHVYVCVCVWVLVELGYAAAFFFAGLASDPGP